MTFLCGWMLWMCLLCVACALVLLVVAQLRHVLSLTAPWLLRTDAHPLRVALFNSFHRKTLAACAWFIGFLDAFVFGRFCVWSFCWRHRVGAFVRTVQCLYLLHGSMVLPVGAWQ